MQSQRFQGLVEGEGMQIPVEVIAVEVDFEARGQRLRRGVDIALGGRLGALQFLACQHAFDMQVAGEVEELAVFGGQSGYSIRTVSNMTSPFGRYCMSTL